jgi:hypothetical protein
MAVLKRRALFAPSALALILSLATTSGLATAMSSEEGEDSDLKTTACALIGCRNGSRECGTVSGTIKAGAPPFVGEVEVEYTCYEGGMQK